MNIYVLKTNFRTLISDTPMRKIYFMPNEYILESDSFKSCNDLKIESFHYYTRIIISIGLTFKDFFVSGTVSVDNAFSTYGDVVESIEHYYCDGTVDDRGIIYLGGN